MHVKTWNRSKDKFFYRLWKTGKLKVTRSGRVFNLTTGKELGHKDQDGYVRVSWGRAGKILSIGVHRLVWLVHGDEKPTYAKFIINHLDEVKDNNRITNLELTDYSGNLNHSIESFRLAKKAEKNPLSKLTNKQVLRYRKRFSRGAIDVMTISLRHDLSIIGVRSMLTGRTYSSVSGPLAKFKTGGPKRVDRDDSTINKIRKLRAKGKTNDQVGLILNMHRSSVQRLRAEFAIP